MRTFRQPSVEVPTLAPGGKGPKARQVNDNKYAAAWANSGQSPGTTGALRPDRPSWTVTGHWNDPDVRGLLYAAQGRVCAFCGLELSGGDRGDVEHYRPKKSVTERDEHWGYWWLTYEADNYVLANRPCNSNRKGNDFPLESEATRVEFHTRSAIDAEVPLILNPRVDDVDSMVDVEFDLAMFPKLVPDAALAAGEVSRVQSHLRRFRCNSWTDLIASRLDRLDDLLTILDQNPVDLDAAKRFASRYEPHSIVMLRALQAAGHPGPTATEELTWWVERLVAEIEISLKAIEAEEQPGATPDPKEIERLEREFAERAWALGCLLRDPPDGDTSTVKTVLVAAGLDQVIEDLLQRHGL